MHSSIYSASNNNTVSPQQLRNSASNNEKSLIFNQFAPTLHNEDLDALSNYPFLFDFTQELAEDSCTWSTSSGSSSSNSSPKPVNLEKCPSLASTYSSESDYEALSSLFANTPDIAFEPWRLLTDSQAKEISSSPDSGLEANLFNSQLLSACFSPMQTDHSFDPCGNPLQHNHHHHQHHHHHNDQSQSQSQSPFYSNSNTPAQLLPALLSEAWSTPSTPYQHYLANNGAFVCRWRQCHAVFDDLDTLVDHLVQVHVSSGKSVYACGWANCPRSTRPFSKRHKIVTHLRTHTGERPFRCDQANCDRSFTRLDALVAHMRIHTNVRPYECPEPGCKRKYFHSRSLRKHTKMHAKWNGMALSSSATTAHSLMSSQLCSELLMESLKNQHESC